MRGEEAVDAERRRRGRHPPDGPGGKKSEFPARDLGRLRGVEEREIDVCDEPPVPHRS